MLSHRRTGKGRTVVLQHGFAGGSGYWTPQLAHLGRFFDVIATDMPGFAGSGAVPAPETIEGYAAALVGLMNELGVAQFSLVGHSMGGMVAQQVALDHGERIEKLILYGTAGSGNLPNRFETFEKSIERIQSEGIEGPAARIAATWFIAGRDHPFYEMCHDAGKGVTKEGAINALRAIAQWDVKKRLASLSMPVLALCGDCDLSTHPDESYALWRAIPDARLCVLPGCAHNVHLEEPDLFNRLVTDFLTRP